MNPLADDYQPPTRDEFLLQRLRGALSKNYWNFGPGSQGLAGFSEGICFLGGIFPAGSHEAPVYAPHFLPGAKERYGFHDIVAVDEASRLREAVEQDLQSLRALKLSGYIPPRKAIDEAVRFKFYPPWLEVAKEDLKCARNLPPYLLSNDEIRKKFHRNNARKGGLNRAGKNETTRFLNETVFAEFEKLQSRGLPQDVCTNAGRPVATRIADKIYHQLSKDGALDDLKEPPEIPTIAERIRVWLKNRPSENSVKPS